ncbi:MAG: hypothetical protein ABJC26_14670 [Gemmatimonadaceae bacterium]
MKILQLALCAACVVAAGCDDTPKPLTAQLNQNVTVSFGQQLNIMTQVVGPGSFNDPTISAPVVEFVERTPAAVTVPAGASDQFQFRATARGTAIITFTLNSTVYPRVVYVDTVKVR